MRRCEGLHHVAAAARCGPRSPRGGAFEAQGGDPTRVRLLRARVMATRLRGAPSVPSGRTEPDPTPIPAPAAPDPADDDFDQPGLWDAERPAVTLADVAGLADVKQHLDSTFLAPLRNRSSRPRSARSLAVRC
ncbi:hypothetical protein NKG05_15055 [Oerskovia sp. M15]